MIYSYYGILTLLSFYLYNRITSAFIKNGEDNTYMTITRLPNNSIPISYDLRIIAPNLTSDFIYKGELEIEALVKLSTDNILLHCKKLNITGVKVEQYNKILIPKNSLYPNYDEQVNTHTTEEGIAIQDNKMLIPTSYLLDPDNELLNITMEKQFILNGTNIKISINFTGILNDDMEGFYRTNYTITNANDDIINEWIAGTYFEPTYARRAFPCYDEPQFKTPFNISIARYPNHIALSNMPLINTREPDPKLDNRVWDTFQITPPMPTYLVAFVISEMSSISSIPNKNQNNFTIWARRNMIKHTEFAVNKGLISLELMEKYTRIPYMLPKMDMVAMPNFKMPAMENWGLIIYNESFLLNKSEDSKDHKINILRTIPHEIAHQWFGNYVTLKWWDFLWLNEGFARYFESLLITQMLNSSRGKDELIVIDCFRVALLSDDIHEKHALTTRVHTPKEILDIFDSITYDKGALILRMLEHIVSTPVFENAVRRYLRNGFENGGSVVPDDLWNAFDQQINEDGINYIHYPIKDIMNQWTNKKGYPLLTVTRNKNEIIVQQETFEFQIKVPELHLLSSLLTSTTKSNADWFIPLTYTTKSEATFHRTSPVKFLNTNQSIILDKKVNEEEWILFNIQRTGYYRVNYDNHSWELLIEQLMLNYKDIHVLNRIQLLDDSFSLAESRIISFDIPLTLALYLDNETDSLPWMVALQIFNFLYDYYRKTIVGPLLKEYIEDRINSKHNEIEEFWKSDNFFSMNLAFYLEMHGCHDNTPAEYHIAHINRTSGERDIFNVMKCTILNNNITDKVFSDKLWQEFLSSQTSENHRIIAILKYTKNDKLLTRYLSKLVYLNSSQISQKKTSLIYQTILDNNIGTTVTLNFIKEKLTSSNINKHQLKLFSKIFEIISLKAVTENEQKLLKEVLKAAMKLQEPLKYNNFIKIVKTAYNETKSSYFLLINIVKPIHESLIRVLMKKEMTIIPTEEVNPSSIKETKSTSKNEVIPISPGKTTSNLIQEIISTPKEKVIPPLVEETKSTPTEKITSTSIKEKIDTLTSTPINTPRPTSYNTQVLVSHAVWKTHLSIISYVVTIVSILFNV